MAKKFIQAMHMKKGALHKELGVPMGENIPEEKLNEAAMKGGTLGRRARTAKMLEGLNHDGSSKKGKK